MSVRDLVTLGLMAITAGLPATVASAQQVDPIAPLPPAAGAVPAPPLPEPAPPVVLPPPLWQVGDAAQFLSYINAIGREGLSPVDYDPAGLSLAMRSGDPMVMSAAATERFYKLASDLALGHVRGDARIDWHIKDPDLGEDRQRLLLDQALATHRIPDALTGLLPIHPQYGALRYALEVTPKAEIAKINRIRLNMDRWRWLPRDLGQKYIIVNVPSFHATLVEDGVTRWKQKAIAGAIKTPTPQLSVMATGVILNPWWEVPTSISGEVAGKAGYIAVKGKDGKVQRWRQPPGPRNALGQMKFVMPNSQAIFLHDTNVRSRFNSQVRALSHGCVRTHKIHDLAAELGSDDGGEWNRAKIDEVLASKKTVEASFVKPLPVHIVYFSVAALTDGSIRDYQDLYKRDAEVIEALLDIEGKAPGAVAKKVASK